MSFLEPDRDLKELNLVKNKKRGKDAGEITNLLQFACDLPGFSTENSMSQQLAHFQVNQSSWAFWAA